MMQASLQAQYQPLALMPAQQQMLRSRPAQLKPQALMPVQHMQPAGEDGGSMQRQMQMLAWQQRQAAGTHLLQLPYTSHTNAAAQPDIYLQDQV